MKEQQNLNGVQYFWKTPHDKPISALAKQRILDWISQQDDLKEEKEFRILATDGDPHNDNQYPLYIQIKIDGIWESIWVYKPRPIDPDYFLNGKGNDKTDLPTIGKILGLNHVSMKLFDGYGFVEYVQTVDPKTLTVEQRIDVAHKLGKVFCANLMAFAVDLHEDNLILGKTKDGTISYFVIDGETQGIPTAVNNWNESYGRHREARSEWTEYRKNPSEYSNPNWLTYAINTLGLKEKNHENTILVKFLSGIKESIDILKIKYPPDLFMQASTHYLNSVRIVLKGTQWYLDNSVAYYSPSINQTKANSITLYITKETLKSALDMQLINDDEIELPTGSILFHDPTDGQLQLRYPEYYIAENKTLLVTSAMTNRFQTVLKATNAIKLSLDLAEIPLCKIQNNYLYINEQKIAPLKIDFFKELKASYELVLFRMSQLIRKPNADKIIVKSIVSDTYFSEEVLNFQPLIYTLDPNNNIIYDSGIYDSADLGKKITLYPCSPEGNLSRDMLGVLPNTALPNAFDLASKLECVPKNSKLRNDYVTLTKQHQQLFDSAHACMALADLVIPSNDRTPPANAAELSSKDPAHIHTLNADEIKKLIHFEELLKTYRSNFDYVNRNLVSFQSPSQETTKNYPFA